MPDRRDVASWLPGSGPRKPGNASQPGNAGQPGNPSQPGNAGAAGNPGNAGDAGIAGAAGDEGGPAYPGLGLGRPMEGPGSIAGIGRRLLSVTIDWVACLLIARAIFGAAATHQPGALWVNVIIAVENLLLVGTAGATLGQRIAGVRVETVDGAHPGLGRAAIRGVLLGLALPALTLLWQRDQRGLHELASGTLVARR